MITKIDMAPIFTDIDPNLKTVSIAIDSVIYEDGVEIARKRLRQAFVPGDIEKVKLFISLQESPEIDYLNTLWTQEVINNYINTIAQK